MANISISNLHLTGSNLFDSAESYLQDLTDIELENTTGGSTPSLVVVFAVVGIAIAIERASVE